MPAPMTAGVTQQGASLDGIAWNILGQTYKPLQITESSFSWHALLPPGTFVPPHIHPTQDEFIYVFEAASISCLTVSKPTPPPAI